MVDKYKTIVYSDYHLSVKTDCIPLIANRDDRFHDYKIVNESTNANKKNYAKRDVNCV